MDLAQNLVVARPLFYFFNDLLDKKNQLDHNRKLVIDFMRIHEDSVIKKIEEII